MRANHNGPGGLILGRSFGVGGPRWARLVHGAVLIVLVVVTTFEAPLYLPAPDAFHEGEYAMYGVAGSRIQPAQPPVLTHGGIDLLPARAASTFCRHDFQIVCVRFTNAVVTGISEAGFLAVLTMISGLGSRRAIIAGLPAMATLIAYNGCARSAFALQTGTPNLRELFILAILGCMFALYRVDHRIGPRARLAMVWATGFLSGLGLFWIYNRGLFGVALTAGVAGALSLLWRDWRPLPLAAMGGLMGLGLAGAVGLYGDIPTNFDNMLYWQRDMFVYSMPFDIFAAAGPAMPVYVVVVAWAVVVAIGDIRAGRAGSALPILTLIAVAIFYGYQVHERPFAGYAAHVLWGLSLLFALLCVRTTDPSPSARRLAALTVISGAVAIGCTMLNFRYMPPSIAQLARQLALNARAMFVETPRDRDLVAEGLLRAADIVRSRSPACSYTFSNEGLFYVLSNTPPCSRFAYPFYVGPDRQAEAISDLEKSDLRVVLWASSTWSDAIFDRGLASRTPELAAWASARFPYRLLLPGGYELRSRDPFDPATDKVVR